MVEPADKQQKNSTKKVPGKPFKKGQSGNPKGRPKKGSAIADILNNLGDETITVNGKEITKREAVLMKVYAEAVKGQSWAVQFIADRTEGKAVERVQKQKIKDEIELL